MVRHAKLRSDATDALVSSDTVPTAHLAAAKRSYSLVLLIFSLPAVLCGFVILALVSPYIHCSGCSIYWEVTLSVLVVAGLDVLLVSRIMYIAWQSKFDEEKACSRNCARCSLS